MPRTRLQGIVFALLMVIFMVIAMEFYNQALLAGGLTWQGIRTACKEFLMMVPICFILSFFIADPIASRLTAKNTNERTEHVIKIVFRAAVTVAMMCPMMSCAATIMIMRPGFENFIPVWLTTIGKNMPMALIWQILFCGPLVRAIFRSMFPAAR